MTETAPMLLRGRTLTFSAIPQAPDDTGALRYESDGALIIAGGRIAAAGPFDTLAAQYPGLPVVDHRPHLIMPGFVDTHIHYPQMQVLGSYAGSLLEWLETFTFPEEQRFADQAHAERIASLFLDELIRHGTTTALSFCTVHPGSVDALFAAAEVRNMAMAGGKVMMDREAPEALTDTAQSSFDDTEALIDRWHGRGRATYAITPRFALTSTEAQLVAAGALAKANPTCLIQSHLSENFGEIERVRQLFPNDPHYTAVYGRFDLLTPQALFGHCIHLTPAEMEMMAEAGAVAVSCPTSNLFLGSGLFPRAHLHDRGVRIGYATDVGGGTSYSMLKTMDESYKVAQILGDRRHPFQSFAAITLGNAQALGMAPDIGTLEPSSHADLVVLDARAKPEMAVKMERVQSLEEELFLLQTAGDDRCIAETYIAGAPMKSRL
ncbi:MAG: guanine deaminase [Devosiaceae bacterium]|nr:guanine deaminase [Devosiaceae bacterium MH13]